MASRSPLHPSHPQFEAHTPFHPPPPSRSSVCDFSAQTPNAELTLQERYPGVIMTPIYNHPSQQSPQSAQCDTGLRPKPKKASLFTNPPWK